MACRSARAATLQYLHTAVLHACISQACTVHTSSTSACMHDHHVVTFCTALLAASEADTRCTGIVRSGGGLALPRSTRHVSLCASELCMHHPAYIYKLCCSSWQCRSSDAEHVSHCHFMSVYLLLQGGCLKHMAIVVRLQRQKVLCEQVPPLCNQGKPWIRAATLRSPLHEQTVHQGSIIVTTCTVVFLLRQSACSTMASQVSPTRWRVGRPMSLISCSM